nr:KilA-N domain-containing protein [uncultured Pseudomonas sp.]
MTARIIPFRYKGHAVRFDADGWLHAAEIAERFGRVPHEWLRLPDTVAYLDALSKSGKIPQLVRTARGRNGGTWLHPKLAVAFARWLSVDFAFWCDEQIDALLRGRHAHWRRARLHPLWVTAACPTP